MRRRGPGRLAGLAGLAVASVALVGCAGGPASDHGIGAGGAEMGTGGAGGRGDQPSSDAGASGGTTGVDGAGHAGVPGALPVQFPIEVLGTGAPDAPVVVATLLGIARADVAAVQSLFVLCHRCGFYSPPEHEALEKTLVKVKASLRIVGDAAVPGNLKDAPWIDVTDATVLVEPMASAHGGINGGLSSLGFRVAIDAVTRARLGPDNRIEFRFNGTDGESNGFRVLDVQLQDASGTNLSTTTKNWDDIAAEKTAGKGASEAANKGRALWTGRDLLTKSSVVLRKIRASCNDCHADEGRDLQYFNYSNNAIVQRSRFHGLSEEQGQQIAAYLRLTHHDRVPHVAAARPWNPPYQPGPGLDDKPIVQWAAGAGLAAVLPDGKAFMKAFVGQPVDDQPVVLSQSALDAAMDPTKRLNMREMPVPLQFPDWNAWLPSTHPLDIWTPAPGATAGLFETPSKGDSPLKIVATIDAWLAARKNPNGVYGDWSHLSPDERGQLAAMLQNVGGRVNGFGGGGRGSRRSTDPANPFAIEIGAQKMQALLADRTAALAPTDTCGPIGPCRSFTTDAFIERATYNLYRWMAIKQWELVHKWGLEGPQPWFHGSKDASGKWVGEGEARGWPYGWPSVFLVAPHMLYSPEQTPQGKRDFYFAWEKRLTSYFRTNQWYQLQITVNPGWPGASNGPVDWPYHMGFTRALVVDLNQAKAPAWVSAAHGARFFQIRVKLGQLANTTFPFDQPDPVEPQNLFKNRGIQSLADLLFKLSPAGVMDAGPAPNQQTQFRVLDEIQAGLHLRLVNASIAFYNVLYAGTDPAKYRRCDPSNLSMGQPEPAAGQRFCADVARTPIPTNPQGQPHLPGGETSWTTAQYSIWGVMQATKMGADSARVKVWSDWNDRMWPP